MDGYLGKRYQLPIDPSEAGMRLLRNLCCDLAVGELATTPGKRNDIVKDAVEAAMAFLRDLAKGNADIPQNPPPGSGGDGLPATISPNEAIVAANDRMFTRNRLRDL
jgi:phage gp36-like protein